MTCRGGGDGLDRFIELRVAHDEDSVGAYLDPDGADELARHLAAWAARQRRSAR